MNIRSILFGLGFTVVLALGSALAQQGGAGVPGGSTFATQYKLNATTFGGTGPGTSGQVLTSRGAGLSPTFQVGGSGGTPGGSNTQIQFNNSGAFGGDADMAWLTATNSLFLTSQANFQSSIVLYGAQNPSGSRYFQVDHEGENTIFSICADGGTLCHTMLELAYGGGVPTFWGLTTGVTTLLSDDLGTEGELVFTSSSVDGAVITALSNQGAGVSGFKVTNNAASELDFFLTGSTHSGAPFTGCTSGGNHVCIASDQDITIAGTSARVASLLTTKASATGTAGFNLPHGAAPTSPVNGDLWTTTAGLFARINGSTVAYSAGGAPGGASTNIQFNNSSAFGGSAALTWNDTTHVLGLGNLATPPTISTVVTATTGTPLTIIAGDCTGSNCTTGDMLVRAGQGVASSSGGNIVLRAGNADTGNRTGGAASLIGGAGTGLNDAGAVNITGGNAASGTSGSVNIGTGSAGTFKGNVIMSAGNLARVTMTGANSASTGIQFNGYGAGAITSDASGNLTAVSDERVKRDIRPFKKGLDELATLNPILYGYTPESHLDQTKDDYAGFSAQNVEIAFPEAVGRGGDGLRSFDERAIVAALVNSVNELNARLIKQQRREVCTFWGFRCVTETTN